MKIIKVLIYLVIAIAGLDLIFGNTNTVLLPSFLANVLTQNIDVVLIAAGVITLVFLL